jgi:hypothetical protein
MGRGNLIIGSDRKLSSLIWSGLNNIFGAVLKFATKYSYETVQISVYHFMYRLY